MRLFFLFMMFVCCEISFAQGFKVGSMKMNLSDLSASTQQRTDAEGQPCGLIKVQTKVTGVEFGGNVVGNVENKTNEYWVYLPRGTKDVLIMRPDYLPLSVHLAEYDIDAIDSKTTYTMVLKEVNLNPEKCGVAIHVKPREAQVKIDDVALKQNPSGDYKVLLPKGDHLVRIDASGHRPDIQTITTGKGVQDINVELESLMADINIISQTGTAEIFVDEKSMGVGGWKGKMMPGKHVIEVRQEGYMTATNQVTIAEKEQRTITIPKLSPIVGSLNIKTIPSTCIVYLDGEEVDQSPCTIKDVVYGNHQLLIKLDSCGLQREKEYDIKITDEKEQIVTCELTTEEELNTYIYALECFQKGFFIEVDSEGSGGYYPSIDAKQWYDRIMEIIGKLDATFFTQIMDFTQYIDSESPTSPTQSPGDRMIYFYTWFYDEWEENSLSLNNHLDPDKATLIAEKLGWNISMDLIGAIGDCFEIIGDICNPYVVSPIKKSNKAEAINAYKKALKVFMERYEENEAVDMARKFFSNATDNKEHITQIRNKIQKLQK